MYWIQKFDCTKHHQCLLPPKISQVRKENWLQKGRRLVETTRDSWGSRMLQSSRNTTSSEGEYNNVICNVFSLKTFKFPFQTNHSDWQNTGATARLNKWTVDIKPCLQYHFKIVLVSLKGQTVKNPQLDLSQTLGPATQEQLKESKYLPEVPTDFRYHRSCQS